ncbi:MAG: peroxiredoxin [Pirellulaceae bacterium]|nr:MAG: peroxiredoxin [Pirellulaceae bacterium]
MDALQLRSMQGPLKQRYRDTPQAAMVTLTASGEIDFENLQCTVAGLPQRPAGLHPAAGGTGKEACSAEMLLQSLVACSGVTLAAVATALEIPVRGAQITAQGKLDFRGTLGVDKNAPVGMTDIQVTFTLHTPADEKTTARLLELTERYCVVLQTLRQGTVVTTVLEKQ